MVQKTVQQWISTFSGGDPLLLTAIVGNNPDQIRENLRTMGQRDEGTPAEMEAFIKELAKVVDEETFFQLVNVENNPNGNPDFTEVLATKQGLWDGSGNFFQSISWGSTFPEGVRILYNSLNSKGNVTIQPENMKLPTIVKPDETKEKMRYKKALFLVSGLVVSVVLFVLIAKKFVK